MSQLVDAQYPEHGQAFLLGRSQQFVPLYHDFLKLAGDCNRAAYLGLAFYWQRGAGHREWVSKSSSDFSEVLPLSKTTQDKCRRWLKEKGLLEMRRTNEIPTRCQWRLNVEILAALVLDLKRPVARNVGDLGSPECGLPSYSKKKKRKKNPGRFKTSDQSLFEGQDPELEPKAEKPTPGPQARKRGGYSKPFEAFWSTASKAWRAASKVPGAKKEAWQAWEKIPAADRPPPEAALEWLAGFKRSEALGIFAGGVPHLCRWLKKDRWTDEWPDEPEEEGSSEEDWKRRASEGQRETMRMLREQSEL